VRLSSFLIIPAFTLNFETGEDRLSTMGNVQCYTPYGENDFLDDDDAVFLASVKEPSSTRSKTPVLEYQTRTEQRFLCIHREDRPQKAILETSEVVKALVEQAEELMRREKAMMRNQNQNQEDEIGVADDAENSVGDAVPNNENDDHYDGDFGDDEGYRDCSRPCPSTSSWSDPIFAGLEMERASTVVTTMSAATQPAKNLSPERVTVSHKKQQQRGEQGDPAFMGGNAFLESTGHLSDDVRSVLSLNTRRNLGKPYYYHPHHGQSNRHNNKRSSDIPRLLQYDQVCGAFTCLEDRERLQYLQRVREHMSVLFLRIKPHCASYYRKHLARLLPDNLLVSSSTFPPGIFATVTPPSPTRASHPLQQGGAPELTRSSDSSSSGGGGGEHLSQLLDFGIGPPSNPIKMLMTNDVLMDLAITGSLGIVDRQKEHCRTSSIGGSANNMQRRRQLKSPENYVVLLNRRSGVPLAVCALNRMANNGGPPTVRVYATKRRVYGQAPASTTKKLGLDWSASLPLYTWAEIVSEGHYPERVRYSIFMASGSDCRFEESPSYRAVHDWANNSPEIRVIGKTDRDDTFSGCAVLTMCRDEKEDTDEGICSRSGDSSNNEDDMYFRLAISKGIDPALMICFAAFVDESLEKTMRIQYQRLSESVYR